MPERHLTDNEIMGIMDGGNEFQDQFIMEHLGICTKCQKSLELYQTLYHELQNTKGFDIPADFTESVMAQVLTVEKTKAPNREFSLIWIISGVITFLGISWHYVGIKPMLEMISILHKSIETLIIGLNGSLNLIIYVGLTLILIAIIDHKIAQTRQDMF